jgi:hypothetical protein
MPSRSSTPARSNSFFHIAQGTAPSASRNSKYTLVLRAPPARTLTTSPIRQTLVKVRSLAWRSRA